jgi:hypothetical protein
MEKQRGLMELRSITKAPLVPILHFCGYHGFVLLSIEHWIHPCMPAISSQMADNIFQCQVAGWYSLFQQQFLAAYNNNVTVI